MTFGTNQADIDFTLFNHIEYLSNVLTVENNFAGAEGTFARHGHKCANIFIRKIGEERYLFEV